MSQDWEWCGEILGSQPQLTGQPSSHSTTFPPSCIPPAPSACYVCGSSTLVQSADLVLHVHSIIFNPAVKIFIPHSWEPIILALLLEHHSIILIITFVITCDILFSYLFPHPLVMISGCLFLLRQTSLSVCVDVR